MRRELAVHDVPVHVEERQRLEPLGDGVGEQRRAATPCVIGRPPSPAIDRVARAAACPAERHAHVRRETIPPTPTASAFSRTTTRCACPSAARTASSGNGRKDVIPTTPILTPSLAQLVDGVLDRAEHRAERHDDRLGVLAAVAAQQPAGVLGRRLRRNSPAISGISSSACICLACARYLTSMNASGPTIAPIVIGSSGSSSWRGSNGGRNASTWPAAGHLHALDGVGEDEAVHAHHHRQWRAPRPGGTPGCAGRPPPGWTRRRAGSSRESRWDIESEWSFQMLIGAPIARLATVITIGRPSPEAL